MGWIDPIRVEEIHRSEEDGLRGVSLLSESCPCDNCTMRSVCREGLACRAFSRWSGVGHVTYKRLVGKISMDAFRDSYHEEPRLPSLHEFDRAFG
jgi:hypothetical protein